MSAKHLTMKVGICVIVRYFADIVRIQCRNIYVCLPYILLRFSAQREIELGKSDCFRDAPDLEVKYVSGKA